MALSERLAIILETVGAGTVVRDFDRVSRASRGIGSDAKAGAKGLDTLGSSGLASSMALKAGVAAAATLAAGKLVDFGRASVEAASALQEQMTAAPTVFGTAADAIIEFADKSSGALGLTRAEALGAMNTLGSFFKNVGATAETSAAASRSMVQLAADIASFKDVQGGVPEVLGRIQSGLRGETESVERLGVNLSATTVKAKAAELGLGGVGRELTEGEKVAARYALIIEQTADAQGDMARTGDNLANQQRKLHADVGRLKEEMGAGLVPVATDVVLVLRGLIDVGRDVGDMLGGLDEKIRDSTGNLANLGKVVRVAAFLASSGMSEVIIKLKEQGQAADDGAAALDPLLKQLGELGGMQKSSAEAADDLTTALLATSSAQRAYDASARAVAAAERSRADAKKDYDKLVAEGLVNEEKVADARRSEADATRSLHHAERELTKAREEHNEALAAFNILGTDTAHDKLQEASDSLADAEDSVASAQERRQKAADDLKKAQAGDPEFNDKLTAAKQRLKDAEQGVSDAQYNSAKAAYDLNGALTTQNTTLAENSTAVLTIRSEWEKLLALKPEIAAFLSGPLGAAGGAMALPPGSAVHATREERDIARSQITGTYTPAPVPTAPSNGGGGTGTLRQIGDVIINIKDAVTDPADLARKIIWNLN